MSRYNDTGHVTQLPGASDIPLYSRVKKTAAGVDLAGATDRTFGSAVRAGYAPDAARENYQEPISVKMFSAGGTHFAIASGAIAEGAEMEGDASGKVQVLGTGIAIGVCMEAATADNDVIEVAYYSPAAVDLTA